MPRISGLPSSVRRAPVVKVITAAVVLLAAIAWPAVAQQGKVPAGTLGIGAFVNRTTMATESFDVEAFFARKPVLWAGHRLTAQFIDQPTDTEFAITGAVSPGLLVVTVWRRGKKADSWNLPCTLGSGHASLKITWERVPENCLATLRSRVESFVAQYPFAGGA